MISFNFLVYDSVREAKKLWSAGLQFQRLVSYTLRSKENDSSIKPKSFLEKYTLLPVGCKLGWKFKRALSFKPESVYFKY